MIEWSEGGKERWSWRGEREGCKTLYYVDSGAPFVLSRQRAVLFIYIFRSKNGLNRILNVFKPVFLLATRSLLKNIVYKILNNA